MPIPASNGELEAKESFRRDIQNVTICGRFKEDFFRMIKARPLILSIVLLGFSTSIFGQVQTVSMPLSVPRFLSVSDVREGMSGTARTVFRGNRSEEFRVEILGVVPNWIGPGQDIIIGRLSGANAERTAVFAGMSGSPVYVDGKLLGAISYSFPFSKEPICGITPIEQMVSVMEQAATRPPSSDKGRAISYSDLTSDIWKPRFAGVSRTTLASGFSSDSHLMAVAGQTLMPIATPVTFSGILQQTIDGMAPELTKAGILPVAAAGGSGPIKPMKEFTDTTLLGGDSVVVQLARGDVQIAAAGTVTLRDGKKIYAFGHPFFSLGSASLPMAESHVVTVVPNANNSFKLSVADAPVGAMTQDRATAIYGQLGQAPKMLPVTITLTTSRGRKETINFESAFDELLTPLIVSAGVANTLNAHERSVGDSTIEMTGEIRVKGHDPVKINRRFTGPQAPIFAASAPASSISALLRANFEGADITGVVLNMTAIDESKTAVLDRISVDRKDVRPGETIEVTAFERTQAGNIITRRIPVTVPADAVPGKLSIVIGDGNAVQQNTPITQFVPKSAADLIATINGLKRSDRLYAVLSRTSTGAVIGAKELPNLPPSMLATINNDRTAGASKPTVNTIISEIELPTGEYIVGGIHSLTVEVIP